MKPRETALAVLIAFLLTILAVGYLCQAIYDKPQYLDSLSVELR